jgi:hypothetical protein
VIDSLLIYFLVVLLLNRNKERKRERGTYYRLIVVFALALALVICSFFKSLVSDNFVFVEYIEVQTNNCLCSLLLLLLPVLCNND